MDQSSKTYWMHAIKCSNMNLISPSGSKLKTLPKTLLKKWRRRCWNKFSNTFKNFWLSQPATSFLSPSSFSTKKTSWTSKPKIIQPTILCSTSTPYSAKSALRWRTAHSSRKPSRPQSWMNKLLGLIYTIFLPLRQKISTTIFWPTWQTSTLKPNRPVEPLAWGKFSKR